MLQVMLTDRCNRACPYCFAREKLAGAGWTELSLADLDTLIERHRSWGLPYMSLAGGEPTLHSRFEAVLERIEAAGFSVIHLFTNGIMAPERADFLARRDHITMLVNHMPPETFSPAAREKFDYFLQRCAPAAMHMAVGTTLYDPAQSPDFLLDTALRHGLTTVRLGLAHPIYHAYGEVVNRFLTLEGCRACAETVTAFTERCAEHGVHVLFDCHFPVCMFTPEQLSRLGAAQPANPPPFDLDCCGQVTVKPDLGIFSCFATGGLFHTWRLQDFSSLDELLEAFREAFAPFVEAPGYDECKHCPAFGKTCSGGCLGQKLMHYPYPPEYVVKQLGLG